MLAVGLLGLLAAQAPAAVLYEVTYDPAVRGRVEVQITLPGDGAAGILVMPRAVPMGYDDVHYDRFVRDVRAFGADGATMAVAREADTPRWRLGEGAAGARRVGYAVDVTAMEREILGASDASKARPGYVGLLGYSVFAYLEGFEDRPIRLVARAPKEWPVFLTLAPRAPPATGQAAADAADFYALADSQVVMGPDLEVLRFEAAVPLFLAQYAERRSDAATFGAQGVIALNALAAYFGSVPFDHYTMHVEFLEPLDPEHGYGFSMEHMESCTIFFDTSRVIPADADARTIAIHLYNLAHHMAHAWIPKRCAGEGYFPWTWEVSPVLDSIWFSEGWGQYAAAAALAEEGGRGDAYREEIVRLRFRDSLKDAPLFLRAMPLVQVSRIASTRYSEDFRTGRNVFSRGGLMAFEIDQAIRAGSGGRKSLRDLLRRLLVEGRGKPLDLDRLPALCLQATGVDIGPIYRRWLGPVE